MIAMGHLKGRLRTLVGDLAGERGEVVELLRQLSTTTRSVPNRKTVERWMDSGRTRSVPGLGDLCTISVAYGVSLQWLIDPRYAESEQTASQSVRDRITISLAERIAREAGLEPDFVLAVLEQLFETERAFEGVLEKAVSAAAGALMLDLRLTVEKYARQKLLATGRESDAVELLMRWDPDELATEHLPAPLPPRQTRGKKLK